MSQAVVRLGDVLEVQNGYAFSSDFFATEAPIGLIRIRDLKRGTSTEIGYVGDYDDDYVVKAGDLLVGMDGEFRCYRWSGAPALLNQRVCRLRNFDSRLEPGYLLYSLDFFLKKIEDETGYVTVKHLSSKTITNIEMALPTVAEQRRIVSLLDAATQHIADLESSLGHEAKGLADLRRSSIKEMFSSIATRAPLQDLVSLSIGGIWGEEPGRGEVDVRVFRSTELTKGGGIRASSAVIRSVSRKQLDSRRLQDGDLLVEKSGGGPSTPVGRVALVEGVSDSSVCSNFMQLLRPNPSLVNPKYLHYFLRAFHEEGRTAALQSNSTNIRNLRTPEYLAVEVPLPSIADQEQIAAELSELDSAIDELSLNIETRINAASDLRQSVLEASFRGEL